MDNLVKESLENIGVNVEKTLARFMNKEEMFLRFLGKFLEEESFKKLELSVSEKNYDEAFKHAHTLKGVSANLGLGDVIENASMITEKLREAPYDEEAIEKIMTDLSDKYEKTVDVIKNLTSK